MYMKQGRRRKAKRFGIEVKIVQELRRRMEADGWTRIKMKSDGQDLDVSVTVDGQYMVNFPPCEVKHGMSQKFNGLDDVAEFLMCEGWKRYK